MFINSVIQIMLIEDEVFDVRRIKNTLKPVAHLLKVREVVSNGRLALDLLEKHKNDFDIVIMDFQIAGGLMGEALIRKIKEIDATIQIIVVTKMTINITDFKFASSLLEAGAVWYCTKYPGDIEDYIYQPTDFILSIFNAYEKRKLEKERLRSNKKLNQTIQDILERKPIIGQSPEILKLRQQIVQLANTDTNLLIRGVSGTGKELVAVHIHYASRRRFEQFVPINCGSLPNELIESELFGFEKGSFTGASADKPGLFEIANKGTIFLDEVSELPPSAQVKLLRVIQEGEIDKIGRTEKIKVDVRIITATNRNLEEEVREHRFRPDLYYRLNVVSVNVPPLNQRKADIPLLIDYYMRYFSQDMNREVPKISARALASLAEYEWPGNIRELQNVVQRLLFIDEREINVSHITNALRTPIDQLTPVSFLECWQKEPLLTWRQVERRVREKYFQFVREQTQSDADAARVLGLAPPNYHRMCKELGLK